MLLLNEAEDQVESKKYLENPLLLWHQLLKEQEEALI